jgi:hypothetical protein
MPQAAECSERTSAWCTLPALLPDTRNCRRLQSTSSSFRQGYVLVPYAFAPARESIRIACWCAADDGKACVWRPLPVAERWPLFEGACRRSAPACRALPCS